MEALRQETGALEAFNALAPEHRDALLLRGIDLLRHEPLILRLAETPEEAYDLMLKIAPELEGVRAGSASFDVARLLEGAIRAGATAKLAALTCLGGQVCLTALKTSACFRP